MQHVLKEAAARRRRCGSAIDSVKNRRFLYPEHLRMMGRYNSLFGIDLSILQEPEAMGKMYGLRGIDRIVVNLL